MQIIRQSLKAETALSLLVAIALFSIVYLSYSQWQSQQNQRLETLYQTQIAWLVLENQLAFRLAGMPCKGSDLENNLQIRLECNERQMKAYFPLGEITLEKP